MQKKSIRRSLRSRGKRVAHTSVWVPKAQVLFANYPLKKPAAVAAHTEVCATRRFCMTKQMREAQKRFSLVTFFFLKESNREGAGACTCELFEN